MPKEISLDQSTYERIFNVSKRVLAQTNLSRLMELILDESIDLSGAERGFIVLLKPGGFEIQSARNMDKESIKKAREKISQTIIREITQSQEPILTTDAALEEKLKKSSSIHRMKLRSVLGVPLKVSDEILGVLYLDNRFAAGVFQEKHAKILSTFADQASLALIHAKLLDENRRRQKELEKNQQLILKLNKSLEEKIQNQEVELEKTKLMVQTQGSEAPRTDHYSEILGESKAMKEVFKTLDRIVDSDVTVYIQGESGTGKELIARALHQNGPRRGKIFVTTNCASYSDTLLESELFGHLRGAFTGAEKDKKGLFEYADGGTVFLDEVADMSLSMQAKLLRVLQEGEIRPVGTSKTVRVNVRVLSATNKDLGKEVQEGKFRKDLFYRLNVVRIKLPPLRDRTSDIPLLVEALMKNNKMEIPETFLNLDPDALNVLMAYHWPGNIRELENEINRALVMGKGAISPELFSEDVRENYTHEKELSAHAHLPQQVAAFEKKAIERALQSQGGSQAKAAESLGISRFTLHQKIKNLGVESVKKKVSPEEAYRVLQACGGNKARAAKKLGIGRQTLYYKIERFKGKNVGS